MATNTNSITLPPIEVAQRAAAELARERAGQSSRIHALNKAAYYLALGNTEVVHGFDGFLIASATRANVVHRVSHTDGCGCEAGTNGRPCWHAATVEILERAGRYTLPRLETAPIQGKPVAERIAAARSERFARALAEINELF